MTKPKVSVLVVNWNGADYISSCIDSILMQDYPLIEIVVVDNNSSDSSLVALKKYKKIQLIELSENTGFAKGNNIAFEHASGNYLFFLNNDAILTKPDTITQLVEKMESDHSLGCLQPKIQLSTGQLDACGSLWTPTTLLFHRYFLSKKSTAPSRFVLSIKGAAFMTRRTVISTIGLFDSRYFCYFEETDFCIRTWVSGSSCLYFDDVEVLHHMGVSSTRFPSSYIQFHNFKNKLTTYLKCFSVPVLLLVIPLHFALSLVLSFYYLVHGQLALSRSILSALSWNVKNIKTTLALRSQIQKQRKISDFSYLSRTYHNPKIQYYFYLLTGKLNLYEY